MKIQIKSVIMWVVGILVLYGVLAQTLDSVIVSSGNISTATSSIPIIGTIASFWWVGVIIMLIGVVMSSGFGKGISRGFRRRRR